MELQEDAPQYTAKAKVTQDMELCLLRSILVSPVVLASATNLTGLYL